MKKVKLEIFKDSFISKSKPWRARVSENGKFLFTTSMFKTRKGLLGSFNNRDLETVRRKDLDFI